MTRSDLPRSGPFRSLLRKEFRSLLPFLCLGVLLLGLDLAYRLLTEFPDQSPLSSLVSEEERQGSQIMLFVLALALASGLLVREQDEGTLGFLDALPVSRARVFWSKFLLALGTLWVLPAVDFLLDLSFFALSRTSLETHCPWQVLMTGTLLEGAACFIWLALGLALSFLRRFSLLVLSLLFLGCLLLQEAQVPFAPLLNPFSLGTPVYQGQHWLWPTAKLTVQLGLACACLAVAFGSFLMLGDPAQRLAARLRRGRTGSLLLGLGMVISVAIWVGLFLKWASQIKDDRTEVHYAPWSTARATTARFQFIFPGDRLGLVVSLMERADAAEARVRQFLGAEPLAQIVADLASENQRHEGQAYWKRIALSLRREGGDLENLVAVLGHETAHVYIDQLSQWRMSAEFNSTRFFHEGLASYLEHRLFRPPAALPAQRRVAAVMRARDEVKIEELVNDEWFTRKRDPDLVYPLGEVFVAALVRRYGDAAPGRVLKAMGRTNAPTTLKGYALWQDTFQAAQFNFNEVVDAFFAELDRAVGEHRAFIATLPRLRGVVQPTPSTKSGRAAKAPRNPFGGTGSASGQVSVRAVFAGQAPGRVVCRFRPRADTPARLFEDGVSSDGTLFRVEGSAYTERSFWYQLGWSVPGASQPIYEAWAEGRPGP